MNNEAYLNAITQSLMLMTQQKDLLEQQLNYIYDKHPEILKELQEAMGVGGSVDKVEENTEE